MIAAGALDGATLAEAVTALGPGVLVSYPATGTRLCGADLDRASARFARGLLAEGAGRGDVVGLLLPTSPEVLIGLFGVVRAGAAAAMLAPPAVAPERAAELLAPTILRARMRFLIVHDDFAELGSALAALCPDLRLLGTGIGTPGTGPLPAVAPEDLAVVQFTSGSTGHPKGVMLPHSAVMAGLRAIVVSGAFTERDVMVSWAPHFHDLGLFGVLSILLAGGTAHVLSPLAFLYRPLTVLQLLSEHGGTLLTGPDFSYRRILSKLTPDKAAGLDLSRWRLAFNGAEPVRDETVADFRRRLAPYGVRPSVMYPVYGMAEATLAITFPPLDAVPRTVHADRAALADHGRVRLVPEGDERAKPLVGVGRPVHGMRMRLVDESGAECADGTVGEIQIAGPAVTTGYLHDPEATARAFDGGWLRTGDLGFRLDGDLFIAGRRKDMIVLHGQNHFPEDVEDLVRPHPAVHRGRCVAFADAETETIVVVAEVRRGRDAAAVTAELRLAVAEGSGLSRVRVHAVSPGWLPQTTSGKWQRDLARRRIAHASPTTP